MIASSFCKKMTLKRPAGRLYSQANSSQGFNINDLHGIRRVGRGLQTSQGRATPETFKRSDLSLQAAGGRPFGPAMVATVAGGLLLHKASLSPGGNVAYARAMGRTPDDSALMLRYKDGDVEAFETLYRRHNDSLYRYLLRLSLNRATAEDIFQEVWGKIIKARHRYRPTAKFTTFLYRVAHNCFIDHVRRNNRHIVNAGIDPDASPDPGDEPDLQAEKSIARRRLDAALETIPAEQRDAFLLHEEAGLSIDTIARITGVKRETVKSRLRYAGKKLKSALDGPALQTKKTA